jgi:hypothetical protein
MRRFVDPRKQGERARHAVYDLVVLLSVIVALQSGPTSTHRVGAYLVLTMAGLALAELYAAFIGKTLAERRSPTREERKTILGEVLGGLVLSSLPLVWLILAALHVFSRDESLDAALWTGVALLCLYAVMGARAAQLSVLRSISWGLAVGLGGLVLVTLKSLLHY